MRPSDACSAAGANVAPAASVWTWGDARIVTCAAAPLAGAPILSDAEQAMLVRMPHPARRTSFIAGRTLLRYEAAAALGVAPDAVPVSLHEGGAPRISGASLCVSIAHSEAVVGVALGARPVGLDVERVRDVAPGLARRMLAPDERLAEDEAAPELRAWTGKEAVLKALGLGLRAGLQRVRLHYHDRAEGTATFKDSRWRLAWNLCEGYLWCVAIPSETR